VRDIRSDSKCRANIQLSKNVLSIAWAWRPGNTSFEFQVSRFERNQKQNPSLEPALGPASMTGNATRFHRETRNVTRETVCLAYVPVAPAVTVEYERDCSMDPDTLAPRLSPADGAAFAFRHGARCSCRLAETDQRSFDALHSASGVIPLAQDDKTERVAANAGINACSTQKQLQKQTPSPGPVEGARSEPPASSYRLSAKTKTNSEAKTNSQNKRRAR
jgi:hypothetical protein